MDGKFTLTQCMALAQLHRKMIDFLYNYAEGKLEDEFFLKGMDGLIGSIDNLVRENGHYNCSYSRLMIINMIALLSSRMVRL